MGLRQKFNDVWRKNAPELIGLFDGSLPAFVAATRPREIEGVPIFCYHLVTPEQLRADLEFLRANGYHTLGAGELLDYMLGKREIHPRSVMLTFDDGPRNFYDVAFPLLKEFSARAVHFIAPGLHADEGIDQNIEARPMDWRQLNEIYASGLVEFQSHTLESRYIPRWPEPAALVACDPSLEESRRLADALPFQGDFKLSRSVLEERLPGAVIEHLSFPMYIGSQEAIEVAKSLGFKGMLLGLSAEPARERGGSVALFHEQGRGRVCPAPARQGTHLDACDAAGEDPARSGRASLASRIFLIIEPI